jgi:ATP-dependent exoDNAse (exonuclease V) alpha subunit
VSLYATSAPPAQLNSPVKLPLQITVSIDRPLYRNESGWQAAAILPVDVDGKEVTAIAGVTNIVLSKHMRVKIVGWLGIRFGKYQIKFHEAEIAEAEYRNPIFVILGRNGVPKVRGETLQNELGEDFAQKIAADPALIKQLFPKIRTGADAILKSCQLAVAGTELFKALNSVGAPQKTIDAALSYDLETQSVYGLIERGLPFAKADALAQHPSVAAIQPFNECDPARIAHAALTEIKSRCGLWGHTGLPLADILRWLCLTYGLDASEQSQSGVANDAVKPSRCREALILGAEKAGLHIDEGRNAHVYLAEHHRAELSICRIVKELAPQRSKVKCSPARSARVMVGTDKEQTIKFDENQRQCLGGIIECRLAVLTGGPGTGKSTLLAALEDHYEGMLIVALAAKAGLRAHEITGARHATIARVLHNLDTDWDLLNYVRVLVLEEASMIGSIQMAKLLEAAIDHRIEKILLVGDPQQLSPIENGAPFTDLIMSGIVPVLRLTQNHRTNPASLGIAKFCDEILEGASI